MKPFAVLLFSGTIFATVGFIVRAIVCATL